MKRIAIIGAGQSGLQLGIGLLKSNYQVSLFTDRSANDILNGKIMSSQAMFNTALQHERNLGIDFWQAECPQNRSVNFTIANPSLPKVQIQWKGLVNKPFQSVDQRLKFSKWLEEFEVQGGTIIKEKVDFDSLDEIANSHDLTIVASGKGSLSNIFQRDVHKSSFSKPMRALSCLYVKNMQPIADNPGVRTNIIPGVGEYFVMPGLTLSGPCEMMLFEGLPGGAFDCWQNNHSPEESLEKAVSLLRKYIPWEADRCQNLVLTDNNATLIGAYTPEIRHPVFKLPSGKYVLGMGDAVVLNDPIAGQGANNASKCADMYLQSILTREDKEFDQVWMNSLFNKFWSDAQWSTRLASLLLLPPEPHLIELLTKATKIPSLANKLANGFDNPVDLFPWITKPKEIARLINAYQDIFFQNEYSLSAVGA